jgi:hypothetical protein
MGTKAMNHVAAAGKKVPTTKTGQNSESTSAMVTEMRWLRWSRPKSAATDQPKRA